MKNKNQRTLLMITFVALASCQATRPINPKPGPRGGSPEYDAILLKEPVRYGDGFFLAVMKVPPGTLIAKEEDSAHVYYFSDGYTVFDGVSETRNVGGLRIDKGTGEVAIFNGSTYSAYVVPTPDYSRTRVEAK